MSRYKNNLPKFNLIVALSYLIKGVKLFPTDEENKRLSPYLIIKNAKTILSPEEWERYSKRVMLIHSRNDRVIRFINFKENSMVLESHADNLLILKKGGHSQKKNECVLVGTTLNFLNSE